ncbi:hypothetical protein QP157_11890 [Sphingomonas sp. LR61]
MKAVDGVVSGYPDAPTAEWAAPGGRAGTWIQLNWSAGTTLQEIDLADRPNSDDQVTGGTLTFSDGTSVAVPSLDNGEPCSVSRSAPARSPGCGSRSVP